MKHLHKCHLCGKHIKEQHPLRASVSLQRIRCTFYTHYMYTHVHACIKNFLYHTSPSNRTQDNTGYRNQKTFEEFVVWKSEEEKPSLPIYKHTQQDCNRSGQHITKSYCIPSLILQLLMLICKSHCWNTSKCRVVTENRLASTFNKAACGIMDRPGYVIAKQTGMELQLHVNFYQLHMKIRSDHISIIRDVSMASEHFYSVISRA